jgi:multicomponent Na+:H+ antiporter subunit D
MLPEGPGRSLEWLGLALTPVRVDALARLFGTAFAIAAGAGALFALDQKNVTERAAALVYAGAAQGVVFAGDLITLFAFWEVMAIGSTLVILSNGAIKAGLRYALIHVLGGVLLFAGIVTVAGTTGDIGLRAFRADSVGHWLVLAGLLVNAGAPPLSAWVADAYPKASWSGAVFLSAFTTKAAVAVLIRLFPGEPLLVWFGLFMALYGLIYALLENDIRRMLSYSIVGQVGYMLVAIGMGTKLALAAASVHAFVHILYKSLLMMGAGSLLRATGSSRLTDLGGLWRAMPLVTMAVLIGGFSLSAMPLTAGFVSKSAIMASIAGAGSAVPWFALTAISAGSFLYAGLKLPWFALLQPGNTVPKLKPGLGMRLAMLLLSSSLIVLGCWPNLLAMLAPAVAGVAILTPDHVLFQLQLLATAALCYVLLLGLFLPQLSITIDIDQLWRKLPQRSISRLFTSSRATRAEMTRKIHGIGTNIREKLPFLTMRMMSAGNWRTGDIAFWATAILGLSLLIAAL